MKKVLCLVLSLCLLLTTTPVGIAENPEAFPETVEVVAEVEEISEPIEEPASEPIEEPAEEPAVEPTEEPAEEPAIEPTEEPVEEPAVEPTEEPAEEPAIEPTEEPAEEPAVEPTEEPAEEPAVEPTEEPAEEPAVEPTEEPAVEPTEEPVEVIIPAVEVSLNTEQLVNLSVLDAEAVYSVEENLVVILVADEGYVLPESIIVQLGEQAYAVTGYSAEELQEMADAQALEENAIVYCLDDGAVTIPFALLCADLAIIAEGVFAEVEETPEPTEEPSGEPAVEPTEEPSEEPAVEPTEEPVVESTEEPADEAVSPEATEEPVADEAAEESVQIREASIVILKQPENVTAAVGETITFSVEATGAVSYQWQNSLDGLIWSNSGLEGSKTGTISIPVKASRYPYLWRCVLTDANGLTLESESAQILQPSTLEITSQPADVTAAVGDTISFSIEATGAASYQWQNRLEGEDWVDSRLNGYNSNTLSVSVRSSHYNYLWRCVVTGSDGMKVYSEEARILTPAYVEIIKQPESVTASLNEIITFSVEASNVLSYQWQNRLEDEAWANSGLEGSKTATITIPVKASRYPYLWRCALTGADGSVTYTDAVQILQPAVVEIIKQPEDVVASVGELITFSIEATGAFKYQWQNSLNGDDWTDSRLMGYNSETLSVTVRSSHYDYLWRCVVTGADGSEKYTETAQILSPAVLEITRQPESVTAPEGETITFTVEAVNAVKYQWQNSLDGDDWANSTLTGYNTETISIPVKASRYPYLWRCAVTGTDGTTLYTNSVQILQPMKITKQPESVTASIDDVITFSVEAVGAAKYQWQNRLEGEEWANSGLEGNNSDTITITVKASRYPYLWRCVLTAPDGSEITTDSVQILQPEVAEFTKQPEDVIAAVGDTISFSVEATGVVKYQWQNSLDGDDWTNSRLSGYNSDTLSVTVRSSHYDYLWRCVITAADGSETASETARILSPAKVEIIKQPVSVTASLDETITFTVEAENVVSYQWQNSLDGADWAASGLEGNKSQTITIVAKTSRYPYLWRCALTGADGSVTYTDSVQILQPEEVEITKQPEDVIAEVGELITFSIEATGAFKYQWQNSLDGDEWINSRLMGYNSETLSVTVRSSHYDYLWRCVVTGADGTELNSETARIVAPVKFEITEQPEDVLANVGDTITFTVTASGAEQYQWQSSVNGDVWNNVESTGADTNTLTIMVDAESFQYQWRCVITSAADEELTTNTVKITEDKWIVQDEVTYEKIGNSSLRVYAYAGSAASVTIPETINGLTVTEIGESAFEGNTALTSIDLPDTITVIGVRSFKDCTNLSEMK